MIPFCRWFLHGEDLSARVFLGLVSLSGFLAGAGAHPESVEWWGALGLSVLPSLASRRAKRGTAGLDEPAGP